MTEVVFEPINPYIYYRFEKGWWSADKSFNYLIDPYGQRNLYFYPINQYDVFNTFCVARAFGGTGNPTRLVFNQPLGGNFEAWRRANLISRGMKITIIKIYTNQPLPLAEDYVQNVVWVNERNQEVSGCPREMLIIYGAIYREYVVQPDQIAAIWVYPAIV